MMVAGTTPQARFRLLNGSSRISSISSRYGTFSCFVRETAFQAGIRPQEGDLVTVQLSRIRCVPGSTVMTLTVSATTLKIV